MAVEAERLIAVFEARFNQLEKAFDKAQKDSARAFSSIEKGGSRAEKAFADVGTAAQRTASVLDRINKSFRIDVGGIADRGADVAAYGQELDNLRAKFNPLFAASRQYEQELDELNRALEVGAVNAAEHASALDRLNGRYAALRGQSAATTTVMRSTRFETANVAAQFQDIAVTLAAGQSPFLIALQQGTQLSQVLGPAGLRGSVSLLAGAFASLVSPVSLVTLGLIAAGGYAVQYFATLMSSSEPAEQTLKQQADLIQRVADKWGDAAPAIKEYANELRRLQESADFQQASQVTLNAALDEARQILPEVSAELSRFIDAAANSGYGSALEQDGNRLANAFDEARAAIEDANIAVEAGGDATDELERAQTALAALINDSAVPANGALRGSLEDLAEAYRSASREAARLAAAEANRTGPGGRMGRVRPGLQPLSGGDFNSRFGSGVPQGQEWKDFFPGMFPDEERGGDSGRDAAVDAAEREREAVARLIEDLEYERSLVGATALEREKANALRRAGAAATEEERSRISGLIETTFQQKTLLEQQKEAYRNLQQVGQTAIQGLTTAMADGKIEAQELLSILGNVLNQMLSFNRTGGGGGIFSLLSGIGGGGFRANTTFGQFIGAVPRFANGTNSAPGGLAWVGERGRELVNLPRGSQVIPNEKLGGGGLQITYAPQIDARGADSAAIARLEAQMAKDKAEFPFRVQRAVAEGRATRAIR